MSEKTFKEAWTVLQRHAQTLRNQSEPNIDDLLKIVTESVEAYKVCQSRVTAVENALNEALKGSGADSPVETPTGSEAKRERNVPDDDIPF